MNLSKPQKFTSHTKTHILTGPFFFHILLKYGFDIVSEKDDKNQRNSDSNEFIFYYNRSRSS